MARVSKPESADPEHIHEIVLRDCTQQYLEMRLKKSGRRGSVRSLIVEIVECWVADDKSVNRLREERENDDSEKSF